jgi:hypothetical protein
MNSNVRFFLGWNRRQTGLLHDVQEENVSSRFLMISSSRLMPCSRVSANPEALTMDKHKTGPSFDHIHSFQQRVTIFADSAHERDNHLCIPRPLE